MHCLSYHLIIIIFILAHAHRYPVISFLNICAALQVIIAIIYILNKVYPDKQLNKVILKNFFFLSCICIPCSTAKTKALKWAECIYWRVKHRMRLTATSESILLVESMYMHVYIVCYRSHSLQRFRALWCNLAKCNEIYLCYCLAMLGCLSAIYLP